ncbi:zinc finger protein 185 isoform X1 [Salarias fasciatus]|uniref:Zinc finger protein 185-like n=1 Tax=Salarias fasciatus TaxID=181472 RepID=A0A672IXZ8_SALFA|nr:nucleolar protein dao-5-like isoform X1 [Salarias fasciatus]
MSKPKEADRATVVRSTQVRTKLKGDNSWCKTPRETEGEPQEEKPWLAEVRARRANGAPTETSPVTSPVKSTPPPIAAKPETERATAPGYRTRGVFTQPDKSVTAPTSNGFSQTTQFNKKPSDSYKRIAPHTVRPTSENQAGQLSSEEQEKRTEAASNVLRKSSARQRSYVLSAAKKFESQPPDTTVVNNTVSFVATRVEITDEDENAPVSAVQPSPVVPAASAASAPEPSPWKTVNTSAKTAVDVTVTEPVAPKLPAVTPAPVKEAPPPASVSNKDLFEDAKPGSTKVATPLPELIAECIEAASSKAASEVSDVSREADKLPIDHTLPSKLPKWPPPKPTPDDSDDADDSEPAAPALRPAVSPPAASPAPLAPAPVVPAPVAPAPVARTPISPTRVAPAPKSPAPVAPAAVSPTPISPNPISPAPVARTPISPTPISPNPISPAPVARTPVSPTPISPTPISPAPISPAPVARTPVSPTPISPTPISPTPVARTPLSTTTAITVNTEPKPESKYEPKPASEWKPSSKPSSGVDTLAALSDTLISFDTESSSTRNDEPALAKEEAGSKETRTTESRAEQDDDDEDSDDAEENYKYDDNDSDTDSDKSDNSDEGGCDGVSDRSRSDPSSSDEEEELVAPVPPNPARSPWSQELLSELRSEIAPQKTSGTLDLLTDEVTLINPESRSLSVQREEEKQTDETAKETQSKEDNADPWSSRVRTTITEWSSADPFDPYPIGTTSPNSSSDLLKPLSSISINRESSTEYQKPAPEIRMSSNTLESLADDIIPIDTATTRISTHRSWTRTSETSTPLRAGTDESQEEEGQVENTQTMIKFERKSSENDSPWDRWTSPTVYNITSTTAEDEQEEEESLGESHTVTTITTIREMHSELEPVMDRYESYSRTVIRDEPRAPSPEPEPKKGFVYLKEYVNATEMSALNSRDGLDSESDYLTSSSLNYSYGSPSYSGAPLSSSCTYCGQQVGEDSKITIEHLGINCHPACFKCGVCSRLMGDLLHSMFLHGGKVHCESCYSKV